MNRSSQDVHEFEKNVIARKMRMTGKELKVTVDERGWGGGGEGNDGIKLPYGMGRQRRGDRVDRVLIC